MNKLETLFEAYGLESEVEFIEEFGFESIVPAICMNDGCDYTTDMEPDQDRGYCEICQTNTVKSALIILGVI